MKLFAYGKGCSALALSFFAFFAFVQAPEASAQQTMATMGAGPTERPVVERLKPLSETAREFLPVVERLSADDVKAMWQSCDIGLQYTTDFSSGESNVEAFCRYPLYEGMIEGQPVTGGVGLSLTPDIADPDDGLGIDVYGYARTPLVGPVDFELRADLEGTVTGLLTTGVSF